MERHTVRLSVSFLVAFLRHLRSFLQNATFDRRNLKAVNAHRLLLRECASLERKLVKARNDNGN